MKIMSVGMAGTMAVMSGVPATTMDNVYAQEEVADTEDGNDDNDGDNTDNNGDETQDLAEESEAEEVSGADQNNDVTEDVKDDDTDKESDSLEESSDEVTSSTDEAKENENNEKNEKKDDVQESTEEVTEELTEEVTTEEELLEQPVAMALAAEDVVEDDVELQQVYGTDVTFDTSSTWDDKGEYHLNLSTERALKSGAKVAFDLYIPQKNAEYAGKIKVQGVARLGSDWTWTQNETIPEFGSSDFAGQTVKIGDSVYQKAHVDYTFGDEITTDYLAEFTIKLAGYQCNYSGAVYIANAEIIGEEVAQTVLKQFGDKDITYDIASEWDETDKIFDLELTSEAPLKSGAQVDFDVYIPQEKADFNGVIKVQGVARLGSNWTWTQNSAIPEFGKDAFAAETVDIDGSTFDKVHVNFTFGDEITADTLNAFTVKLAGWKCDYNGPIYYDNLKVTDGVGKLTENVVAQWTFDENIDGWYYDGTWDNKGDNSVVWNEGYKALQMNVDYSKDVTSTWSEIKTSFWGDEFKAPGVNKLTFDFIYDSAKLQKGMFKTKVFSNSGVNTDVTINLDNAEDYDGTLKKVPVSLSFDQKDIENGITIGIIGYETNYQGEVYLDNVTLISQEEEDDGSYVYATKDVTGQSVQLSVDGNILITGAGNSQIAQNITLADKDATDDAKEVYAYLQAIGQTDSVIFGQQNNTHHKAGAAELSNSDTKDVVGSYAGVIGMDTLSLTGNEYSADRYVSEMNGVDSEYESTVARINAAATTQEKNVIAAAALTNYNIRNGAIITLSAHMPNFSIVNSTGAENCANYAKYDFSGYSPNVLTGDVMNKILPGGEYNEVYTAYLDMVVDYAKQVNGAILFRPFHENTGSWFWWGAAFCDAQTYKSVYKYTVDYLKESGVHNMLYEYGPGSEAANTTEYGERYPGDGYVDLVGFDMYHRAPSEGDTFMTNFKNQLNMVQDFAREHGKLVAVTETGVANDAQPGDNQTALLKKGNQRLEWFTEIQDIVSESNASYFLVWANFGEKDGFYTPYVKKIDENGKYGHEMMDPFIDYFNNTETVFAVNQQAVLNQLDSIEINAESAAKQEGYITSPIAGSRILEPVALNAKVNGISEGSKVTFVLKGANDATVVIPATLSNGYYTAAMSADDLAAMGEFVGQIALQVDGETIDSMKVTFNIPEPEKDPYEIDGFENYYGTDSLLTKAWATNKATGSNITLTLDKEHLDKGEYAMRFEYNETSDGWAGATISKEVSWADCDALSFWTIPDGNLQKTVIQITAGGNVYEYYMNLNEDYAAAGTEAVHVTIPFSEFVARDISGNPKGGLVNDKANITSFGLWVNAIAGSDAVGEDGMVSGVIYYDNITAVAAGLDTAKVVLAKDEETPDVPPTDIEEPATPSTEEPSEGEEENQDAPSIDIPDDVINDIANDVVNNNTSSSSGSSSSSSNEGAIVVSANPSVKPSYIGANGVKVTGWDAVIKAAYEDALLNQANVPLASDPNAAQTPVTVDINVTNVTELVIPEATVEDMAENAANYNIYYANTVITLTPEILNSLKGDLDLKVNLKNIENFGEGFRALSMDSRTKRNLALKADMHVCLGDEYQGKPVYIYQKDSDTNAYELTDAQLAGGNGVVHMTVEDYLTGLVLY